MIERAVLLEATRLFNGKLYFECHDWLEEVWSGTRGEDRDFLQALIHLSVGLYHLSNGNHQGASSLLRRAVSGLRRFEPRRDGLEVEPLLSRAERCLEKTNRALSGEAIEWEVEDIPLMRLSSLDEVQ